MSPHPDLGFGARYVPPEGGQSHYPFYVFEHGDRRVFYWNPEEENIWLVAAVRTMCGVSPEAQFNSNHGDEYHLPVGTLTDALAGRVQGIRPVHGGLFELAPAIHDLVNNLGGNNG